MRGTRRPADLLGELRRTLRDVDPAVFVYDVRTMDEHLVSEGGGFLAFELGATVTSVFGAAGVLLAAIGLYGMIAGRVTQRTQEFGVRIALGADRGAILRDVLGRAVRLASIGIVVGAVLAAVAAQGLSTLLLDVSPFDPLTYIVVSLFLVAVCVCASFIPGAAGNPSRSHRRAASGVVDVDSRDIHAPPLDVQASSTGRRSRRRDSRTSRAACR